MAKKARLTVTVTTAAHRDITSILEWTTAEFGPAKAEHYEKFLYGQMARLGDYPNLGPVLGEFAKTRRLVVRFRSYAYGHIVIYRIQEHAVEIIRLFHTAQDWWTYVENLDLD